MTTEATPQTPAAAGTELGTETPPANQTPATETPPANSPSEGSTPPSSEEQKPKSPPEGGETATELGGEEEAPPVPGAEFQGYPEDGVVEVVAPDGMAVDETLRDQFLPIAKDLNLNQKGIQKLIDLKAQDIKNSLQRWGDHVKDLKVQAQADPEIGGAKYAPTLAAGKAAITKFAGSRAGAFRKMLNDYGIGSHPEMIRFLGAVGAATGETPILPSGEGSGDVKKPLHEILYKD